ncbi:MAG: peptidoglycan DD-metalloendopeptidase family protein [Enhygromyxa sp.]
MRPRLTTLLLLGAFGCGEERAVETSPTPALDFGAGEAKRSAAPRDPTDPKAGDAKRSAAQRGPADPFEDIEALRPEPWTDWPLENVDIETAAGWRINPVSGEFELEQGLILTSEPGAFVLAIAPGEVLELHSDPSDGAIELVLDHGGGIESRYAPLADALVHAGLPVTRGAAIGLARGKTLRLSVTIDKVAIDPLLVLRQPLHRWPALLRDMPETPTDPS